MREIAMICVAASLVACTHDEPTFRGSAEPIETAAAPGHDHAAHAGIPTVHDTPEPACGAGMDCGAHAATGPQPIRTNDDGSRLFGNEMDPSITVTSLEAITSNAEGFADHVVRTEGTIARVCQAMGCWMELRAENVEPVRVPMAGHSYFLPRDVAGRPAVVEGRVVVRPLSDDARRHLESEGAVATASSLSIQATSVLIR